MVTYIVLANFTDQGIRNVKESVNRAQAFRDLAGRFGVTVKDIHWTLGSYDLITTVEAPDEQSATALGLTMGTLGNVRTLTLRAFSASEMSGIIAKMP